MTPPVPNPPAKSGLHPLVAIAAISVTAFSLFGIAAINGWLPSGKATSAETPTAVATVPASEPKAAAQPVANTPAPVEHRAAKPVVKAAPKPAPKPAAKPASTEIAQAPVAAPPVSPPALPVCGNCGVIDDIREITQPGEATGLGAVAGGVVGAILGHQIGGGTGKKLATVAGAAGGAYAGHQIEKSQRKTTRYEVIVRMNDGTTRSVMMDTLPGWRVGERVRIENGTLVRD
ncbi:glycine zipper 2TM domain-containing protein [Sulfuricystis multivorans]|uniref:glycine zipper 2TM domain-containing protein n=1 Tax=Sulfuricystis multivorans TaxID=2211108 RepID=UPI000F819735|nr:glycine zipper 2TM domain-containing protein [Sulfuricystis multivorans]